MSHMTWHTHMHIHTLIHTRQKHLVYFMMAHCSVKKKSHWNLSTNTQELRTIHPSSFSSPSPNGPSLLPFWKGCAPSFSTTKCRLWCHKGHITPQVCVSDPSNFVAFQIRETFHKAKRSTLQEEKMVHFCVGDCKHRAKYVSFFFGYYL